MRDKKVGKLAIFAQRPGKVNWHYLTPIEKQATIMVKQSTEVRGKIMAKDSNPQTSVALFQEKSVRRVWYQDRWFFSVIDVIAILTESDRARKYWSDLKTKLVEEGYIEVSEKIGQLKMEASDGKMRVTDAADTTTLLRIIQSIPSPRADPFKRWLAEVGAQRIEEIENPEKAMERMRSLYEQKGYPAQWIDARMRGIAVRNDLTAEWKERGAKEGIEYAILTNEIAEATFGLSIAQHRGYKGLKRENIREHMTDLETILNMLGEATATKLHQDRDTQGFPNLQVDAKEAGQVAGNTRRDIEKRTGSRVVSRENYLHLKPGKKKAKQIEGNEEDQDKK
jgi:DNA-damage-inducible protein D